MKVTKEQFVGVTYEELLAENAKLHTQLADVTESMGRVEERYAKLRELVSVMPRCWNADCDGCPMAVGKTVYGYGFGRCVAKDKLRELGVEVEP